MTRVRTSPIVSTLSLLLAAPLILHAQTPDGQTSGPNSRPVLAHTCLITENVKRLVEFYEPILQQKANWSGDDYAEFAAGAEVLAIFSSSAQEKYIAGSADAAKNRSVILEFKVADADAEYRRLRTMVSTWVKPPTTQPWGTRSIYFRDPDGNLVDFYSLPPASGKAH
jgi:catechol 2,3-dioxygenase-like lactoylglutathione lyase family enzyme